MVRDDARRLLQHLLAALAYRTQKALRDAPPRVPTLAAEAERFHAQLQALSADLADASLMSRLTDEQLLQGPFADAMTHAGQLAMLRRLARSPVPSENFIEADISARNLSTDQALPVAPDSWWRPDQEPLPPGPVRSADPDAP